MQKANTATPDAPTNTYQSVVEHHIILLKKGSANSDATLDAVSVNESRVGT